MDVCTWPIFRYSMKGSPGHLSKKQDPKVGSGAPAHNWKEIFLGGWEGGWAGGWVICPLHQRLFFFLAPIIGSSSVTKGLEAKTVSRLINLNFGYQCIISEQQYMRSFARFTSKKGLVAEVP